MMAAASKSKRRRADADEAAVRQRILHAAFLAFMERGYAATSTLEIATRARVSKRALYALVGNKQEMLMACISERAKRLQAPTELPVLHDRESLGHALASVGVQLLREISDPAVIAVFRLAIADAVRAPEVARALDSIGGEASRAAVKGIMTRAAAAGLVRGDVADMAGVFAGLLWGNLMLTLLLGVVDRPGAHEIGRRARAAAAAFLQLYSQSDGGVLNPDPGEIFGS